MMGNTVEIIMPYANVQNGKNWCWVVAAKLVGAYTFNAPAGFPRVDKTERSSAGIPIENSTGFREQYIGHRGDTCTVDETQYNIAKSACNGDINGDRTGDDEQKCRALEFMGKVKKGFIPYSVHSIGRHDREFLTDYGEELAHILAHRYGFIGNFRFMYAEDTVHSVACFPSSENSIYMYDPWDGYSAILTTKQLFQTGFLTNQGSGKIAWIQYIDLKTDRGNIHA